MQPTQGSAVQKAKGKGALCVIPNENLVCKGGLYSRLWCGWEAYQAREHGVRILLHRKRCTPQHLFGDGDISTYTLQNGKCGAPKTKSKVDVRNETQIKAAIGESWANVDAKIKIAMMNSWRGESAGLTRFLGDKGDGVFAAVLFAFQKMGKRAAEDSGSLVEHFWTAPEDVCRTLLAIAGVAGLSEFLDKYQQSSLEYAAAHKCLSAHLSQHKPSNAARAQSHQNERTRRAISREEGV